ncbi:hypothetical protein [Streptomyces sp. NPDC089919]|uniref:hypothetical protein n=1 Tax=Streptomyces sp. NPDC089919 TaxID=3155188 RepID=UPI00344795F4
MGVPGENRPDCDDGGCSDRSGGGVYVFKGTRSGITTSGSAFYGHKAPGLPVPKGYYRFGGELKVTDLNGDRQPEVTMPVYPAIWSVGTKDGRFAGTSPTRVVKPSPDPKIDGDWAFGQLAD